MPTTPTLTTTQGLRSYASLRQPKIGTDALGKEAFLNILVAQLANQNPLEPTSDTEFVSQLAQFSALEQMQSLNTAFLSGQNRALLDKFVLISEKTNQGEQVIYGRVDGLVRHGSKDHLLVAGFLYLPEQVVAVADKDGILNLEAVEAGTGQADNSMHEAGGTAL